MKPLPFVTEGYDLPSEQPVDPGRPAHNIGIHVFDDEPRIVMTLTNPSLKFGQVECWPPIFECELPLKIEPINVFVSHPFRVGSP